MGIWVILLYFRTIPLLLVLPIGIPGKISLGESFAAEKSSNELLRQASHFTCRDTKALGHS